MTTIEQLQQIVNDEARPAAERREAAKHILKLQGQQTELDELAAQIPDDDPEVLELTKPWDPELAKMFPQWANKTLPEAKKTVAWRRSRAALKATVADESLPMSERIDAAETWRSELPKDSHWHQYGAEGLVERLTTHPHYERLKQLRVIMDDEAATVKARFAAIDEFRRMRDEFPKRELPQDACVLNDGWGRLLAECSLAYEVGKRMAAKFGKSRSYVAEVVLANRGIDYDFALSDIFRGYDPAHDYDLHFERELGKIREQRQQLEQSADGAKTSF